MKVIELLKSKEWSGKVIDCVLRFALSFALAHFKMKKIDMVESLKSAE